MSLWHGQHGTRSASACRVTVLRQYLVMFSGDAWLSSITFGTSNIEHAHMGPVSGPTTRSQV